MKIKRPSLKGMKSTKYLGHFAKNKYIQKGHNDSGKIKYLVDNDPFKGAGGGEPGGESGGDISTSKSSPQKKSISEYVSEKTNRIDWNAKKEELQADKAQKRYEKYNESGQSSFYSEEIPEVLTIRKMSGDMPEGANKVTRDVNKRLNKIETENYKNTEAKSNYPYIKASNEKEKLSTMYKDAQRRVWQKEASDEIDDLVNKSAKITAGSLLFSSGHIGDKTEEEMKKKRKK